LFVESDTFFLYIVCIYMFIRFHFCLQYNFFYCCSSTSSRWNIYHIKTVGTTKFRHIIVRNCDNVVQCKWLGVLKQGQSFRYKTVFSPKILKKKNIYLSSSSWCDSTSFMESRACSTWFPSLLSIMSVKDACTISFPAFLNLVPRVIASWAGQRHESLRRRREKSRALSMRLRLSVYADFQRMRCLVYKFSDNVSWIWNT